MTSTVSPRRSIVSSFKKAFQAALNQNGPRHSSTLSVQRQTNLWIPSVIRNKTPNGEVDATDLLTRAGYVRQAYAGIFHMLPLGLRVQTKIEQLVDKHMTALGASKVSLSSLSSQEVWNQSGRLQGGSEFFKITDRRGIGLLLSPTHEEEITRLARECAKSYRDLPLRLYQISRKYRDERRPRGGLLRGREFLMKDLYTFDVDESQAMTTYDNVRQAYGDFFDELRVDYLTVAADSGAMGGNYSHEYHLRHSSGEDDLVHCPECGFAKNEELVDGTEYVFNKVVPSDVGQESASTPAVIEHVTVSRDGTSLVKAFAPSRPSSIPESDGTMDINSHAVKAAVSDLFDLDTGIEDPLQKFKQHLREEEPSQIYYLFDHHISPKDRDILIQRDSQFLLDHSALAVKITSRPESPNEISLLRARSGDSCPECHKPTLQTHKAIEVGHTFHLGTRYSAPGKLNAVIDSPDHPGKHTIPMQMGCHGIGVSRLIAAVAACLSDSKGLQWPKVIAPFQVALIVRGAKHPETSSGDQEQSEKMDGILTSFADRLTTDTEGSACPIDVLYDDRPGLDVGWKMVDADMIGYPVVVVFGRAWEKYGKVEVRCRRLKIQADVSLDEASGFVQELLEQL